MFIMVLSIETRELRLVPRAFKYVFPRAESHLMRCPLLLVALRHHSRCLQFLPNNCTWLPTDFVPVVVFGSSSLQASSSQSFLQQHLQTCSINSLSQPDPEQPHTRKPAKIDVERHCAVSTPSRRLCPGSMAYKRHTNAPRSWRSASYGQLLAAHMETIKEGKEARSLLSA